MRIEHDRIEYLPGAVEAARGKFFSGGLKNNREYLEECVEFDGSVPDEVRALLLDPQTSGGLLAAVASDAAEAALAALERHGSAGRIIGTVISKRSPLMQIT